MTDPVGVTHVDGCTGAQRKTVVYDRWVAKPSPQTGCTLCDGNGQVSATGWDPAPCISCSEERA